MAFEHELSQDEIDALLQGVTGEAEPAPARAAATAALEGPQAYKLGTDERVVRGRLHTLEVINERFARQLRSAMLVFMRRSADISVGAVEVQKYAEFVRHLPVPANINLIQMKPLRGTALFVFDPKLIFLVVDNLFGSDGRYHVRVEGRDFTQTEQRIIKRLLNLTLESYGSAWNPVYPLYFDYVRSEMHARLANIVEPNEMVIVTTFQIEFGPIGGALTVCIPYSMIEPIRPLLSNPLQDGFEVDKRWIKDLSQQVQSADLELRAHFLTFQSSIGQLLTLQVGDVLPVEIPGTIVANVNGVPVMECGYGTSNSHYALRVQKMINHLGIDPSNDKESAHE
ncbi:MAG: flagellar motor switch protein FliM [Polaromonas sp. 24-62-144]|jgi:flagellar motor switch protein FliM|uniref:flagellar motor switch protein FliM n=1 Tax=Polaromonas sp. TaxID=1869339 RepID=UPI000BCC6D7B|nr:flagellar motor switch protein FliM [Polaromonas sp.]OYY53918.1 MAG: flagellar motor switch protein FliM [Polaromonas sp. 35-63-240]OYZ02448.1 MAG: flagellar motor switch protein FliM [Polaromonas sp. 28-63-22]OYZ84909.1 MAG: flagellar motor switch protein FliM [Polaromonas sp. 24-62-144]HQS31585.1 flagellar motor switch protein FliM [Polaromonas sp.]HQS90084.1 flagellar motor switch protein FliM [Polaromonas sp.]